MVEKIKRLCATKKMGIRDLERELGFGNGAIYKWETSSPSVKNAKKVADFFGVTVNDLLDYDRIELTRDERRIIELFRTLNEDGQIEAIENLSVLASRPRYIKNNPDTTMEGNA